MRGIAVAAPGGRRAPSTAAQLYDLGNRTPRALRPGLGAAGAAVRLLTNHYAVKLEQLAPVLQYDVKIVPVRPPPRASGAAGAMKQVTVHISP